MSIEISNKTHIIISGAAENNLKNISIAIPKNKLVVITGLSGSGKSSLAFNTICEEGRRLYIESLNSYAKQFENNTKPNVESIKGLSPTIAIDQKTTSRNPRSTVATSTEIYDYLRILFVRIGIPYSPLTKQEIHKQTPDEIFNQIISLPEGTKILILSPIIVGQKGEHRKELISLRRQGYKMIRIDGIDYSFSDLPVLDKNKKHTLELILGKISISKDNNLLKSLVRNALVLSNGILTIEIVFLANKNLLIKNNIENFLDKKEIKIIESLVNEEINTEINVKTKENSENNYYFSKVNKFKKNIEEFLKIGDKFSFSEKFACPVSGFSLTEIEPRIFSFNSPYGACLKCDGIGNEMFFSVNLIIPDRTLSLKAGAIAPWKSQPGSKSRLGKKQHHYDGIIDALTKHYNINPNTPFCDIPEDIQNKIIYGDESLEIPFFEEDGIRRIVVKKKFNGIINYLQDKIENVENNNSVEDLQQYQSIRDCSSCKGYRIRESSLSIKIDNKHIGEVCRMSIDNCILWFKDLPKKLNWSQNQIADRIIKEILKKLSLLSEIGLGYLSLDRKSSTLSGGESQRIRIATQIGSGLSSIIYVLDEPSIGLHQSDNDNLLRTLKELRDQGNTVIVVEHDEDTMLNADYIIDIGPEAGDGGGKVVAAGTPQEIMEHSDSITAKYLRKEIFIQIPEKRRNIDLQSNCIKVTGASEHNLKNIDVVIPLNALVVVSGVSGSGKSTFIIDTLYPGLQKKIQNSQNLEIGKYKSISGFDNIDKIIEVDQSPIGRTPRSNPATYINVFTLIRELYASLPEAKMMGYNSSRFSFNVKGGRCESCEGDGTLKIDMYFMPEIYIPCEHCNGKRYNSDTLKILYMGKSISDVLDMTIDNAIDFFENVSFIKEKLITIHDVGLGYIKLGQSATTLSGGEAQRIKLAKELTRKSIGHTLYIFDEPTTGLHSEDIRKLMKVINYLIDSNNSVIIIEHNMDVIKIADYILDFGPYGGDYGGEIIASGPPHDIVMCEKSLTGKYLKKYL
ncbi:excinuclease ABC subunit UvrA [Lyticum sinuosum]|uniref:UvrABC system protein A n=1 Tax=Lyticum sinuosum TaxID=1332059 RepID=A0AAE4VJP9_9RICK|nr:excinuclease ABC subunit UvrA [Lyticum sinuosum]MDZ5761275.1 UvrABC system protein A [Lyticum sinuosum]